MYNLESFLQDSATGRQLRGQLEDREVATFLRSIKLKIISNCNLRCDMCKYWRIAKQQLEVDVIYRVLDSAATLGCRKVHLSGGEVTLHPQLTAAIRHARELGMRVNLTSNGILMDKNRARQWIAAGLRAASFSLDGAKAKTHDRIRGVPGAFKRTLRAISILRREIDRRQARLRVRVNTVLSRHNLRQLPALVRLAGDAGAVDLLPMPIDGKAADRPTPDEIAEFNREVVPQVVALRQQYGMPLDSGRLFPFGCTRQEFELAAAGQYALGYYDRHACYAPWLHAFISHTGAVFACCMTRAKMPPLGNVKQQSLAEIFQGEKYASFRQQMLQARLAVCANCDQYLRENRLVRNHLTRHEMPVLSLSATKVVS